jgi:hypothetical protein
MSDPNVYPITAALERNFRALGLNLEQRPDSDLEGGLSLKVAQNIIEYIGEYEHGTVDVSDLMDSYPYPKEPKLTGLEYDKREELIDQYKNDVYKWKIRFMGSVLEDFFICMVNGMSQSLGKE